MTMHPKLERLPSPAVLRERRTVRERRPSLPPPAASPDHHTSRTGDHRPCDPVDPSLTDLWSSWPGRVHAHAAE
jgi:hypothetical protein